MTNVADNVTSDVTSLSPMQLTERQREIIRMINENERISAAEMSRVLSVVVRTIRRDLNEMQEKGIIKREGNTSAGKWIILRGHRAGISGLQE